MSRAKAIFLAALEQDEQLRADFVRTACAGDPGLAERVGELLAAHDTARRRLPGASELVWQRQGAQRGDLARILRDELRRPRSG